MKTIKELIDRFRDIERQVAVCTRCGICQSVCPVYGVTGNEADVARGKLSLIDGLAREMFADPEGVSTRVERCLLCGACAAECPRGVDAMAIFFRTRGLIREYSGLPFHQKLLFRQLLGVPRRFDRLSEWIARYQHLVSTPVPETGPDAPLVTPLLIGRRLPPIARIPFRKWIKVNERKIPSAGDNITAALFVGCLIDKVFPEVATAVIESLACHGIDTVVPEDQGCCGIPALSAGDRTGFERLVKYHVGSAEWEKVDVIVTGCATCTAVIRKIWPAFYLSASGEEQERVSRFVQKTVDIAEFLVREADISDCETPSENPVRITYHDPCHLKRTLGISDAPRRLIRAHPHYSLVEMNRPEACCGMGGSFGISHRSISKAIGEKKKADIESTGASIVATGCPACMIQLRDLFAESESPVEVRHTAELYARGVKDKFHK